MVADRNGKMEKRSGTSYAASAVAALVAYWRALNHSDPRFNSPAAVKASIQRMTRRVHVPYNVADYKLDETRPFVSPVSNGQLTADVECVFGRGPGCHELHDGGTPLDDMCGNPAGGLNKKRQADLWEWTPPDNGDGNGGGGEGGQDQLGPSKTFTYLVGTPSPTCTSGCGTYCTHYWCRPDGTGEPLHFTEPTRLPSTPAPPPPGGGPMPDGAATHASTVCSGSDGRVVCGPVTSCFNLPALPPKTSCALSTTSTRCVGFSGKLACAVETHCVTLPPLPAPTSCSEGWTASLIDWCNGSGGRQVCAQSTFCVTTPRPKPTYRVMDDSKCPGAGEICIKKRLSVGCGSPTARGLRVPTPASGKAVARDSVRTADAPPPTAAPGTGQGAAAVAPPPKPKAVEVAKKAAIVKPPRRPHLEEIRQVQELQVSPVPSPALVAARQLECVLTVQCETCLKPKPAVPDPCIEIKMLAVATGLGGTQVSAELSVNGRIVCRPSICATSTRRSRIAGVLIIWIVVGVIG